MLDTVYRDELRAHHSIKSGFIVARVCHDSTVEKIGLRRGDVIDLDHRSTVVELEEFLLGLAWVFLEKKLDSHSTIDVKIRVHDIRAKTSVCTILPMGFSFAVVCSYYSSGRCPNLLTWDSLVI
uniref:PDZ domain-containing protein n=1 Tax=Aegilops tauschii subsp. strangulata TaxID=200361 RepID=A0A452YN23_AEGTS